MAIHSSVSGWQNEFIQQQQQTPRPHPQQVLSAHHRLQPFEQAFQPSFTPSFVGHLQQATPTRSQDGMAREPLEIFDENAFAAAFEQASADMETQHADANPKDDVLEKGPRMEEEIRIGSDTIPHRQQQQDEKNDADELAKTAGHLLNSVSHEQDQKFKQSNFLALMRRLRDREVEVAGDEFREVSTNP